MLCYHKQNKFMGLYLPKLLILLLLVSVLLPFVAEGVIKIDNPLEAETFQALIDNIIKFMFQLAIWIAPIMFIVAGFYFFTAAGSPEKVTTAKKIVLYTLIGLLIIFSARALVAVFENIFLK